MANTPLWPGKDSSVRGPSLRGAATTYLWRGIYITRPWPAKRGKPKSAKQQASVEWFRQANFLAKYTAPIDQVQAKKITAGTMFYPRDIQLMCMAGRAWGIITVGGKKIYSMAARQDVSLSLDVIEQIPGSLLFRGPSFWDGVIIGTPGQMLIVAPDGASYAFADQPIIPSSSQWSSLGVGIASSVADASRGVQIKPLDNINIIACTAHITQATGAVYQCSIWTYNTGTFALIAQQGVTHSVNSTGTGIIDLLFTFTAPVPLTAGTSYILFITRTDATDTTTPGIFTGGSFFQPGPIATTNTLFNLAHKTIAAGQTPAVGAGSLAFQVKFSE